MKYIVQIEMDPAVGSAVEDNPDRQMAGPQTHWNVLFADAAISDHHPGRYKRRGFLRSVARDVARHPFVPGGSSGADAEEFPALLRRVGIGG